MEALAFTNLFGSASDVFKSDVKAGTVEVIGEVTCIVIEPVEKANPFADSSTSGELKMLPLGSVWSFRDMDDDGNVRVLGGKWFALVADDSAAF